MGLMLLESETCVNITELDDAEDHRRHARLEKYICRGTMLLLSITHQTPARQGAVTGFLLEVCRKGRQATIGAKRAVPTIQLLRKHGQLITARQAFVSGQPQP